MTQDGLAARWVVEREPALHGYQVEWAEPGDLLLSRRNQLFRTSAPGQPILPVAHFPAPSWKRNASRLRAAQRLLRFMFYNVVKLADGRLFASFDKSIGIVEGDHFEPIHGLVHPARILRSACAIANDGNIYFGEYHSNRERGPMRIYRYTPGETSVEVAHTFPAGGVRHVHGIYLDPYDGSLWCVTGDNEGECRIIRSRDGFETLETIGDGDESWRAVSLAFTESHIYYAMDAQFTQNQVLRMSRHNHEREVLGDVDGPVFFCRAIGDDVFFAITAELCPSQVGRSASLVCVSGNGTPRKIAEFEKDRLHVSGFMMGTLNLPRGPWPTDHFYLHGVALRGADNETFVVRKVSR